MTLDQTAKLFDLVADLDPVVWLTIKNILSAATSAQPQIDIERAIGHLKDYERTL